MPHVFSSEKLIKINTSMNLSRGIRVKKLLIFNFVTKCKFNEHSLTPKKRGMGILRWEYIEIHKLDFKVKLIYTNEKEGN
jgi:hypothetical protein